MEGQIIEVLLYYTVMLRKLNYGFTSLFTIRTGTFSVFPVPYPGPGGQGRFQSHCIY